MDPWAQVSASFSDGFQNARDRKFKKKMLEEELKQKMSLMQLESELQNQELTPEQKLMQAYKQNPTLFTGFQAARDPYKPQELQLATNKFNFDQDLETGKFNMMKENNELDRAYKAFQMQQGPEPTPQMKNFEFLSKQRGLTPEQALQTVFGQKGGQTPGGGRAEGVLQQNFNAIKQAFPDFTNEEVMQIALNKDPYRDPLQDILRRRKGLPSANSQKIYTNIPSSDPFAP